MAEVRQPTILLESRGVEFVLIVGPHSTGGTAHRLNGDDTGQQNQRQHGRVFDRCRRFIADEKLSQCRHWELRAGERVPGNLGQQRGESNWIFSEAPYWVELLLRESPVSLTGPDDF